MKRSAKNRSATKAVSYFYCFLCVRDCRCTDDDGYIHRTEPSASEDTRREGRSIIVLMPKSRRHRAPLEDAVFRAMKRRAVPHAFVLEALAPLSPQTRSMFGCLAIYVGDKIVLLLRDRPDRPADNGVWLATTVEHHESLRREFPNMRSIQLLGKEVTGWQVLPVDTPDFESAALCACELIVAGDPRIGKVPKSRRPAGPGTKKAHNR
jgi:hypothetical protein